MPTWRHNFEFQMLFSASE